MCVLHLTKKSSLKRSFCPRRRRRRRRHRRHSTIQDEAWKESGVRECGWERKNTRVRVSGRHRIERLSSLATKRKWKAAVVKGKKREREEKMKIKQSLHLSRTQPQSQRCQLQQQCNNNNSGVRARFHSCCHVASILPFFFCFFCAKVLCHFDVI